MKKILLGTCLFVICALTHAATTMPANWDPNTRDKAVINQYIAYGKETGETWRVSFGEALLKLADLGADATYAQVKAAAGARLCDVLWRVQRFSKLIPDYIADETQKNKWAYNNCRIFLPGLTQAQYIQAFEDGMKYANKTPVQATKVFNRFMVISKNYPAADVLKAAKNVKRSIYVRITDEAWKPLLVKLELMIQSLQ